VFCYFRSVSGEANWRKYPRRIQTGADADAGDLDFECRTQTGPAVLFIVALMPEGEGSEINIAISCPHAKADTKWEGVSFSA